MDIRVLRYFLAIVDTGSLSRASIAVAVTQPSLSRQIRSLERELDVQLFNRAHGRLTLTASGKRFVPIATDLVARVDDSLQLMRELGRDDPLSLVVAANLTTLHDIVAPFAAQLRSGVTLDLRGAATVDLPGAVGSGEVDIALSALPGTSPLTSVFLARFSLFACVPASHRWSGREQVSLPEVIEERLILLRPDSMARRLFDDAVARLGRSCSPAFEVEIAVTGLALAAAGHGVAVLTDEPRFDLSRIQICDREDELLTLPLFAVWDPSHYAAEHISHVVAQLRTYLLDSVSDAICDGDRVEAPPDDGR
jgi:DNA-binding transcriptional LysR family regulator